MTFNEIKTFIKDKIIDSAKRSKDKNISPTMGNKNNVLWQVGSGSDVLLDGITESVKTIAAIDASSSYGYLLYNQTTATSVTVNLPATFSITYRPVVIVYDSTGIFKIAGYTVAIAGGVWRVSGLTTGDFVTAIGIKI